jgi:RND family efflux transporter MFP subunit
MAVAACGLGGCRDRAAREPERPVVRVARAIPATSQAETKYIALVRGEQETTLSFKVRGRLDWIGPQRGGEDWREGQEVTGGAVLAQLNLEDFRNALDSAKAGRDLTVKLLQRARELSRENAMSPQELDRVEADWRTAQALYAQREQELNDATLRAPHGGLVLLRLANSGETVAAGQPVLRIGALNPLAVEFGVPDSVVGRIRLGQTNLVQIPALPGRPFEGVVTEVGAAAMEGGRLFRVVLKLENPPDERGPWPIKSGMVAYVRLGSWQDDPRCFVLVPLSALFLKGTNLAVYVLGKNDRVRQREVETGEIIRSSVLVPTHRLQPGEQVVIAGASLLHEDAWVDARPVEAW